MKDDRDVDMGLLEGRHIEPEGHVPLTLSETQLLSAFNDWLRGLRFAPGRLKKTVMLDESEAMYVPVWLVSGKARAKYRGERGKDYKEKEQTTDASGETQTREISKTRWSQVSGEVEHRFEEVVVCGWSG